MDQAAPVGLNGPAARARLDSQASLVGLSRPAARVCLDSRAARLRLDSPAARVRLDSPAARVRLDNYDDLAAREGLNDPFEYTIPPILKMAALIEKCAIPPAYREGFCPSVLEGRAPILHPKKPFLVPSS